jgi:hypothetical protein
VPNDDISMKRSRMHKCRQSIGEAKEIGAALGLSFEHGAQSRGLAAGLQQHGGVDAVDRRGFARRGRRFGIATLEDLFFVPC